MPLSNNKHHHTVSACDAADSLLYEKFKRYATQKRPSDAVARFGKSSAVYGIVRRTSFGFR